MMQKFRMLSGGVLAGAWALRAIGDTWTSSLIGDSWLIYGAMPEPVSLARPRPIDCCVVSMWRKLGKQALNAAVQYGMEELRKRQTKTGQSHTGHPQNTSGSPKPAPAAANKPRAKSSSRSKATPTAPTPSGAYLGDYTQEVDPEYAPVDNNSADPGEVVWAWVPYEEDHTQGKDRPVLVIGRSKGVLLALPLTSKDHDRDAAQEARAGRTWMDVGTGAWDRKRRPSEVRLDRVLQLRPRDVRRVGAALDARVFDRVVSALRSANGWS